MNIKNTISIILVAMIILIQPALVVAEATTTTEPKKKAPVELKWVGTVKLTSGNLNIRKGPSLEEEVVGKLPNEAKVEVLEQSGEWATINHNGTTAYVSLDYLSVAQMEVNTNLGMRKTVVLDPGHGGRDPGAIIKDGTYESDLVWEYTIKAKKLLEQSGYIVHLTRTESTSCMLSVAKTNVG